MMYSRGIIQTCLTVMFFCRLGFDVVTSPLITHKSFTSFSPYHGVAFHFKFTLKRTWLFPRSLPKYTDSKIVLHVLPH